MQVKNHLKSFKIEKGGNKKTKENETFSNALAEVNNILKYFPRSIYEKIPQSIIDNIQNKMNKTYKTKPLDDSKTLDEQDILEETKQILAMIYRNYIISDELKENYISEEREISAKLENEKRLKYNPDNIFKNKQELLKDNKVQESVIIKKNFFQKLIYRIKIWFN